LELPILIISKPDCQKNVVIMIALTLLVLLVYWQVQGHDFISYDDQLYVTDNFRIHQGISVDSIAGAFKDVHTGHWHPLTMISHMVDWSLFGDSAGGHHWTNVVLHILNTILLFFLLQTMTGALWRSALVATLFAIHPMNVESVAWVSERKNVLSTLFWITTILFYVRYVQLPNWKRYAPVMISFTFGLLSKPMLITLPFVLLLFDYWPLKRTQIDDQNKEIMCKMTDTIKRHKLSFLILEKIPLFLLSALSIVLTVYAAKEGEALMGLKSYPLLQRISNALVSYVLYIRKLIWPVDLSVFYPYVTIPLWWAIGAALFLMIVTIIFCIYYRKFPYLIVGWLFYLGTLVPVIGFIQVGRQSMADRYAYIPFIGFFIMISWSLPIIKRARILTVLTVTCIIITFSVASYQYIGMWSSTVKLFEDIVKRNPQNHFAYNMLGLVDADRGEHNKALYYFYLALKIKPDYSPAYLNAGNVFLDEGKYDQAIYCYKKAVLIDDLSAENHNNLGAALMIKKDIDGGISSFKKAIELRPDYITALNNLGVAQMQKENIEGALQCFKQVLKLQPDNATAIENIKILFNKKMKVIKTVIKGIISGNERLQR